MANCGIQIYGRLLTQDRGKSPDMGTESKEGGGPLGEKRCWPINRERRRWGIILMEMTISAPSVLLKHPQLSDDNIGGLLMWQNVG